MQQNISVNLCVCVCLVQMCSFYKQILTISLTKDRGVIYKVVLLGVKS